MLSAGWLTLKQDTKLVGSVTVGVVIASIAVLSILTGGLNSTFILMLFLVPIEVALISKDRSTFVKCAALVVIAAGLVAGVTYTQNLVPLDGGLLNATVLAILATYAFVRAIIAFNTIESDIERVEPIAHKAAVPLFEGLLASLPGLVTRHNVAGDVTSVHGQQPKSLSVRADNLLGRGFVNQIHISDRIRFMSAIDKLRQGTPYVTIDLRFEAGFGLQNTICPDLQFTYMQANLIARFDHDDQLQEFFIQSLDMTELHDNEQAIQVFEDAERNAEIAKTSFLAGVSHELRTPLNSIMGFADILIHEVIAPLPDERHKEYVSLIRESGEHLLSVVNTMLDMSKIQNGQYTLYNEPFEFGPLLDRTKSMLDIQAGKKQIELNCRRQKDLPEICADSRALQQILINLVGNSIKFTEEGGVVTVDAEVKGSEFILSVSDTGIGIPENKLSQIGQPFMQVNSTLARRYEGTGLGLSLVKGLVELHNGVFDIKSIEGKGTQITITIPQLEAMSDIDELDTHNQTNATEPASSNAPFVDTKQAVYQGDKAHVA